MKKFVKTYTMIKAPEGVGRAETECNLYSKVVLLDSNIQLADKIKELKDVLYAVSDYTIIGEVECTIVFKDNSTVKTVGVLTKTIAKDFHFEIIEIWIDPKNNVKYRFIG